MAGKKLTKPAAWAITHNLELWPHFNPFASDAVIIGWSLADNYRTKEQMAPGDRAVFWEAGPSGGVARVGFVLDVYEEPGGSWTDHDGHVHDAPYSGEFYLPPLPRHAYLPRTVLARDPDFQKCELIVAGVRSSQPPLRIEAKEWVVIEHALRRLDKKLAQPTTIR